MQEVWDALETWSFKGRDFSEVRSQTATVREAYAARRNLLRFLDELDGDMTVYELREALEEYKGPEAD